MRIIKSAQCYEASMLMILDF